MIEDEIICAGDVIQIDPKVKEYGTMLAVVRATFKWGIYAYICMKSDEGANNTPVVFVSLNHDQYEFIEGEILWEPAGIADMIDEELDLTEQEKNVIHFNPNIIIATAQPYKGTEEQNKEFKISHTDEGATFEVSTGQYILINLYDDILTDTRNGQHYIVNRMILNSMLGEVTLSDSEPFIIDRHMINQHMKDRLDNVYL